MSVCEREKGGEKDSEGEREGVREKGGREGVREKGGRVREGE